MTPRWASRATPATTVASGPLSSTRCHASPSQLQIRSTASGSSWSTQLASSIVPRSASKKSSASRHAGGASADGADGSAPLADGLAAGTLVREGRGVAARHRRLAAAAESCQRQQTTTVARRGGGERRIITNHSSGVNAGWVHTRGSLEPCGRAGVNSATRSSRRCPARMAERIADTTSSSSAWAGWGLPRRTTWRDAASACSAWNSISRFTTAGRPMD